jgi:pyruvate kinase
MEMRKTKIVCTLGPATEEIAVLRQLLEAGMNVARFNMAHGDYGYHAAMIDRLRQASRSAGIPVALLIDTKGPEIRTGKVAGDGVVTLKGGSELTVTTEDLPCTSERVSIDYRDLPDQMDPGKHILIADGLIDLEVVAVQGRLTRCLVLTGGELGSHKNVNLPGIQSRLPAITEKDRANIRFGIEQDMDFVAASFVRRPEHVLEIQQILAAAGSHLQVIAKIEDQEGLANIDDIIRVSQGIMIARGDLGVQLPTEEIPLAQKRIILKCHRQNKAVITATQMLDSMIHNPKPTRAEATDVANAIFDGSDAVMLSGETASGKYPVPAVKTMDGIARAVEESPEYESRVRRFFRLEEFDEDIAQSMTRSAYLVARETRAAAIITPTLHGTTPKLISRYRPRQPILAVTPSEVVARQLLLYWGVVPLQGELVNDSEAMLANALKAAVDNGFLKGSDVAVILAGIPIRSPVMLNTVRVHFMGSVLAKGKDGFGGYCSGTILKAESAGQAGERLAQRREAPVLLTRFLTRDFLPLLKGLRGIILEEASYLSWPEIKAAAPRVAVIGSVPGAMSLLADGQSVSLHGDAHIIYEGVITR